MRHIWILNRTTLYIEQVADATKMAEKWLQHLSYILLMVNWRIGKREQRAPVKLQVLYGENPGIRFSLFHCPCVENKLIFFHNKFTPASNDKAKMLNDES